MSRMRARVLAAAAVVAAVAVSSVSAQAQNVRVRGAIEKLEGNTLTVKSREGADLKLALKDNVRIAGVIKASLADVKAGNNVAITSRPRADGTLEAVELRIAPAGQPFNSFHGDWDLMPNSFMTNGQLETSVAGVDGQVLTVKYKVQGKPDEEKKIVVTPKTIIATTVPGTKADLAPGKKVFVRRRAEAARRLARRGGHPGGKGNSPAAITSYSGAFLSDALTTSLCRARRQACGAHARAAYQENTMKTMPTLAAATLVAALSTISASAQQPQGQRLSGEIQRVDGNVIFAKSRDGAPLTIKLADDVRGH